jgi:glycosyltransferase involved in cell wall biosynthesis
VAAVRVVLHPGTARPCPNADDEWVWLLADGLGRAGHEVHLFGCGGSRPPAGGSLHYLPGGYGLVSADLDLFARRWYADVLEASGVVHDLTDAAVLAEQAHLDGAGSPVVVTRTRLDFRHPRFGRRRQVVPSEEARAAGGGTAVWTGGEAVPEWLTHPGRLESARVVVPAVDLDFYRPAGGGDAVLCLGPAHPVWGWDRVLEAARALPDVPFRLALSVWDDGLARHAQAYQALAASVRNAAVEVLPEDWAECRERRRALYQGAACLLLPLAGPVAWASPAAEALACGCPVLATAEAPGHRTATLAPEDAADGEALGRAVAAALATTGPDAGAAARAAAEFLYRPERMVAEYEALYCAAAVGEEW